MRTVTPIEQVRVSPGLQEAPTNVQRLVLAIGVFTIALGGAAIVLPSVAALTIDVFLGMILVVVGVTHILGVFPCRSVQEMILRALPGVAYGLVGFLLLAFPRQGLFTLTALLAALFIIVGALKMALALHAQPVRGWGWLMLNGIVAAALGTLMWAGLPGAAAWVIGLLVGIELTLAGLTLVLAAVATWSEGPVQVQGKELR